MTTPTITQQGYTLLESIKAELIAAGLIDPPCPVTPEAKVRRDHYGGHRNSSYKVRPVTLAPGEVRYSDYVMALACRFGISPYGVRRRIHDGKLPEPLTRYGEGGVRIVVGGEGRK